VAEGNASLAGSRAHWQSTGETEPASRVPARASSLRAASGVARRIAWSELGRRFHRVRAKVWKRVAAWGAEAEPGGHVLV